MDAQNSVHKTPLMLLEEHSKKWIVIEGWHVVRLLQSRKVSVVLSSLAFESSKKETPWDQAMAHGAMQKG